MSYIFNGCESLISLPDISKWDISSVVHKINILEERDSLKAECEVLRDKVEKYEAKEKSVQVESIISGVLELFSADEISELREESKKYSLDELNIFENEVKAKSYDKMISSKNFSVKDKSFTKMAVNDVLDNKQNTSKYTWK